ncbi:TonB-dependent receptor [Ideonella sp. DXS22W]|uniref:TonB-dependent receptor n=1 Tax=Pseudaquabacterium inlustre TaxID=2984192 RepID=A0ABU9CLM6_9BURK
MQQTTAPARCRATRQTAPHAHRRIMTRSACALAAAAALLPAAHAQQTTAASGTADSSVVITGTLIRGAGPVGSPVTSMNRQAIEQSGAASTTDLLRQLPQIHNLGADEGHTNTTQNANQNVTVGSGINLRGLGPESTLTLLSGRRVAPGGVAGQFTDPSSIPAIAIERMEVLTDGASATYGSDAVGGVVNMRLRRGFEGVEGQLRIGAADGLHQELVALIGGKSWGSGNVMVALERNQRSALSADARRFYTEDMRPWGGPDLRVVQSSPGNVLVSGVRYAIPAGQNGVGLVASGLKAGTSNLQSITKGISALPEQHRDSIVFSLSQDITDSLQLGVEGFWTERQFRRNLVAANGNYTVRNTNPFFVSPTGSSSVTVNYSFLNDLGNAVSTGFERSQQLAATLNWELAHKWSASAFVAHSVTQEHNLAPSINTNAINAALADTNAATALNLFCDGAAFTCNNPATLAKLGAYNSRNSRYTLKDVGVKADGPLFMLPAGQVRLAVGGEYHEDQLPYYLTSNNTTANTSITKTVDNSSANPQRTVQALFAEAYVPLISPKQGVPGVQRLDLSLAARHERYSDFGTTSNPKVGLSWVPAEGLEVRGTYSTAFRAPTLGDTDPVNGSAVNVVDRIDADGKTSVHGILYLGGNPVGLKPETAHIATLGLGFRPNARRGTTASLDYFNIDYRNRILTPGNDVTALQRPELAAYVNRNPTAEQIQAAIANPVYSGSATEPVAGIKFIIDGRRFNAGVVKTSGVDFAARHVWDAALGTFTAGVSGTYIIDYRQQFTPTTPLVGGLLNTLNNPLRLRGRLELGWAREGLFQLNAFINHTNAYNNTTVAGNPAVAAASTLDFTLRYELGRQLGTPWLKGTHLTLAVQNLLDAAPPYVQNGTLAFDPQNVSAVGRMVSLTVGKRF